jgi:hypothetical protein
MLRCFAMQVRKWKVVAETHFVDNGMDSRAIEGSNPFDKPSYEAAVNAKIAYECHLSVFQVDLASVALAHVPVRSRAAPTIAYT